MTEEERRLLTTSTQHATPSKPTLRFSDVYTEG
jgi:hypothetical protein